MSPESHQRQVDKVAYPSLPYPPTNSASRPHNFDKRSKYKSNQIFRSDDFQSELSPKLNDNFDRSSPYNQNQSALSPSTMNFESGDNKYHNNHPSSSRPYNQPNQNSKGKSYLKIIYIFIY